MEKRYLTPVQAWDEFYKNYVPENGIVPNELIVANSTRHGKQKQAITGKPKNLGVKRIARLLEKYAPGKYHFNDGQPYFTTE